MNKKFFLITLLVLAVASGLFFLLKKWSKPSGNSIPKTQTAVINWDNPEEVFKVAMPEGFDAYKQERLKEKIESAKILYNTKKDETWTWITIGNMYEFARDYDRAIGAYEKAGSINKLEYISQMNLAYIYENQKKDFTKAEKYYKKVVELNGSNPEQYVNLARLYEFKMMNLPEAEKTYLLGLEKTGENPDLLVAFIRFYERSKNTEKIKEYAGKLLKLDPDNQAYKDDFEIFVK